jgi:hypothetical protein
MERQLSNLSLIQICKPEYDCVVEIGDSPLMFSVTVSFASVPSGDVSQLLQSFSSSHPGVQSVEDSIRENVEAMNNHFGIRVPNPFEDQRPLYSFNVSHVYEPKSFGKQLSNYLSKQYGLKVKLMLWSNTLGIVFEETYDDGQHTQEECT